MIDETERTQIIASLKELGTWSDKECAHMSADNLLCALLEKLGFEDVVDAYEDIDKWYA